MKSTLLHAATVFMGFFAIMNPIANVPIFLGLTSDDDEQTVAAVALRSVISPLAMPILAGPGTIATAMNFSAGGGLMEVVVTIIMFAILCIITYILFIYGGKLVTYIGASALGVITRIMGLIIAVIGTQMVIEGLTGALKHAG